MVFKLLVRFLAVTCVLDKAVRAQFIYVNNAAFKFIAGIGLPLDVNLPGGSLAWFTNVQVFYNTPDNITLYEPYKVMAKRSVKNTFNRPTVYQALEKYFDRLGFYGNDCLQRVICETARRKINRKSNGLIGEVLHILFSPINDNQQGLDEHKAAQLQGLTNSSDCGEIYKECFIKETSIFLR